MGFWGKVEDFWEEHHINRWLWGTTVVFLGINVLSVMVVNGVTENIRTELEPIKTQLIPPEE